MNSAGTLIDLAGFFTDPDLTNSRIQFVTSQGAINVELFDTAAPRTVANFFNYIESDRYDDTIFHRRVNNFVLQGGGFDFDAGQMIPVETDEPVLNEFGAANVTGTLAMAKRDSGPDPANSATSQFFFNLANNTNLNTQNGGFTVFGRVVAAADTQVVNSFAALTSRDMSDGLPNIPHPNDPFDSIPLVNYSGSNATFPTDAVDANFARLLDVLITNRDEFLAYSVVGNTTPDLVSAVVVDNRLTLNYAADAEGTAQITIRATDRYGASLEASFQVTVGTP